MASPAAFEAQRRMLECKRSALIAVTREASRLISADIPQRGVSDAPVRIVTVHARHGRFRQTVAEWLTKLRHDAGVTTRALLIDVSDAPGEQLCAAIGMNLVTSRARHLIFRMTALETSRVRGRLQMARKAASAARRGGSARGIYDLRCIAGLRMLLARAVAGLARATLPFA
jgi:hypothetical protein